MAGANMATHISGITRYLTPDGDDAALDPQIDGLYTLLCLLVDADACAQKTATAILADTKNPRKQLVASFAQQFLNDFESGLAARVQQSLLAVSELLLTTCQDQLLPLATHLDEWLQYGKDVDRESVGTQGSGSLSLCVLFKTFQAQVIVLRQECCSTSSESGHLLSEVQTLIPQLSRLSSQIDTSTYMGFMDQDSPSTDYSITMEIAHLVQFNSQVRLVLSLSQRILNVMMNWQDNLNAMLALDMNQIPAYFYQEQVQSALLYWATMHHAISQQLNQKNEHLAATN
jgi:hypothetical protein